MDIRLPVPPTRFLIVHYHIFKNGGSTIASILEREFENAFATVHGPDDVSVLDHTCLADFVSGNTEVRAISSHHLRYPKPVLPNTVIFDCCFLRNPLDRLQSVYSYFQRIDSDDPLCRLARQEHPRTFFKRLIDSAPHLVSNVQVTLLALGGAFTRPADIPDVDTAADIVGKMAIPGLVENFDESLVSAEYFLKPAFPRLRLDYRPQNVSRPLGASSKDRQEWLRHSWGSDLYATLMQLNQCDLELCRRAEREVARRLSLVPGAEHRLAEFRARCPEGQVNTPYRREHIA
ncbi:MAG: uncharacterized protein JWO19_5406 [Bryobacterales bacterium]|nr:uncharacterized protein [Bryobacterales bacterium]